MDINEFVKQVRPRAKRSQLDPFKAQIFELRELGYANWQIRDWLATNGIEVTQESVRKFVITRESANEQLTTKGKTEMARPVDPGTSSELVVTAPVAGNSNATDPGAAAAGLSLKQRREKLGDEFIKPENTNPLLKRLKDKNR